MSAPIQISPGVPRPYGERQPAVDGLPGGVGGGRLKRERRGARQDPHEWFRTPPAATAALLARETFPGPIWECAAGDGAMARVLIAAGYETHSTDLVPRGWGLGGVDFLREQTMRGGSASIVTNPPYSLAAPFLLHAQALGAQRVALLLRLAFLEGMRRHRTLFRVRPPNRIWVFSSRLTMWRGDDPNARETGGATPYAWMVWDAAPPADGPRLGWIAETTDEAPRLQPPALPINSMDAGT
ncbi:hypothetical protein [Teichococcus aestuarii]|uniref:hypothetical protein n=1 Tax=Teichococcus aestuarii TaxID=568898 RepID=UPI0036192B00